MSWHLNNPLTGKTAEGTVAATLPGGSANQLFNAWLDKVATFMQSLKGKKVKVSLLFFVSFMN